MQDKAILLDVPAGLLHTFFRKNRLRNFVSCPKGIGMTTEYIKQKGLKRGLVLYYELLYMGKDL